MPPADAPPAVPKPRLTARGVAVAALCWLLYALLYAAFLAQSAGLWFGYALSSQLVAALILGLCSLPAWWLTVRAMDRAAWGWTLAAHVALAPLYAGVGTEAYLLFVRAAAGAEVTAGVRANGGWILFGNLVTYGLQFAIYHMVRSVQRLRLKEQHAAELMALARARELAALKAQINPHFLFNTLNSISATVKEQPDEARAMIARLAGLLRHALDSARQSALIPLRDELDFAKAYLALEQHRFSDRLRVEYDVDEAALGVPVPPMVLQPLVENAVRHGIAPLEEGGTVALRIAAPNGRLHVRVEDTGAGPSEEGEPGEGIGLATTSARLERLFGPAAALRTAPNEPRGFTVEFFIPVNGQSGGE